jgi:hypothetical protein
VTIPWEGTPSRRDSKNIASELGTKLASVSLPAKWVSWVITGMTLWVTQSDEAGDMITSLLRLGTHLPLKARVPRLQSTSQGGSWIVIQRHDCVWLFLTGAMC